MSGNTKPKIYWDSCIYLAWLKGEEKEHGKSFIDAIHDIAKDNYEKKVVIITSTITFVEVLSARLDAEQERKFRKCFRSMDHITRDVDPPIALRARELRETIINGSGSKKLTTPDAIHLATASIYEADFWTFDAGGNDKKSIGLLELNDDVRVGKIKICKPEVIQARLL
jgi:predicted nucleic acid-binding protein